MKNAPFSKPRASRQATTAGNQGNHDVEPYGSKKEEKQLPILLTKRQSEALGRVRCLLLERGVKLAGN